DCCTTTSTCCLCHLCHCCKLVLLLCSKTLEEALLKLHHLLCLRPQRPLPEVSCCCCLLCWSSLTWHSRLSCNLGQPLSLLRCHHVMHQRPRRLPPCHWPWWCCWLQSQFPHAPALLRCCCTTTSTCCLCHL